MRTKYLSLILFLVSCPCYGYEIPSNGFYNITGTHHFGSTTQYFRVPSTHLYVGEGEQTLMTWDMEVNPQFDYWEETPLGGNAYFKFDRVGNYQLQYVLTFQKIETPFSAWRIILKVLAVSIVASLLVHFTRSLWRYHKKGTE